MSMTDNRVFSVPTYDQNSNPLDNQYLQIMRNVEDFIITTYSKEELVARHDKVIEGLEKILTLHTSEAVTTSE